MSFYCTERVFLKIDKERAYRAHCQERWKFMSDFPGFVRSQILQLKSTHANYMWTIEWVDRQNFETIQEKLRNFDSQNNVLNEVLKSAEWEFSELVHHGSHGLRRDFRSSCLDATVEAVFAKETSEQREILESSLKEALRNISIGALEGRLIEILLTSIKAKKGIELGALGGYSASWILRALGPEGRLVSIERNPKHAALVRQNLASEIDRGRLELCEGEALDILMGRDWGEIDFAFIDADKINYPHYVRFLLPLIRKGGLLIIDNAYLWGAMSLYKKGIEISAFSEENRLYSVERESLDAMADTWAQLESNPDLKCLVIPTADGLGVALKV